MQPTKSYRSRLNANLSGSDRIDLRRPTQHGDDSRDNGRITVFSDTSQTAKGLRPPKYLMDNNVYGVITTSNSPLARKARQSLRVSNGNSYDSPRDEELQLRKLLHLYSDTKTELEKQTSMYMKKEAECNDLANTNMKLMEQVEELKKQLDEAKWFKKAAELVPQLLTETEEGDKEREQLEIAIDMYRNLEMNQEQTVADAISIVTPTLQKLSYVCPALQAEILGMQHVLNTSASPVTAIASILKRTSILLVDEINTARGSAGSKMINQRRTGSPLTPFQSSSTSYYNTNHSSVSSVLTPVNPSIEDPSFQHSNNNVFSYDGPQHKLNGNTRQGLSVVQNHVALKDSPSPRNRMIQNIKQNLESAPTQKERVNKARRNSFV